MRDLPKTCLVTAPLLVLLALGCQASVDGGQPGSGAGGNGGGGTLNLAGGVALPPGTEVVSLLPARIRRLSVAEYQASVSSESVIGAEAAGVSADFVPDARQSNFTLNAAQRVDPVFARQLSESAIALAAKLRAHAAERAPCANEATDADKCADQFIRDFGAQAYRRPLGDDEVTQLMGVFHTALDGGSYAEGIEIVVRAMLQSAAFLYLTEIGDAPAATIKLTPAELASSISYLIRGGPPSAELMAAANAGRLDTPEGRASVLADPAISLYVGPEAEGRVVRVIREWLGTDKVAEISKDSNVYPGFLALKDDIRQETTAFLEELVSGNQDGGSLNQLLGADWTVANSNLATLYGVNGGSAAFARISTPGRLGILNQSAFLSVFAHASETAPVLRGVAVMRRVACIDVGDPVDLKMAVVPPAPDPTKTTRQRFAAHSTPGCNGCHDRIDNFGFAFEGFDGIGRSRSMDGPSPVDSSVVVAGTDFDGSYADSNALAKAMSTSSQVRQCFARHVFRALAATSEPELKASEDDFVKYWSSTLGPVGAPVADVKIIDTISAFIQNPGFAYRRAQ
jgi:hypothetical protein